MDTITNTSLVKELVSGIGKTITNWTDANASLSTMGLRRLIEREDEKEIALERVLKEAGRLADGGATAGEVAEFIKTESEKAVREIEKKAQEGVPVPIPDGTNNPRSLNPFISDGVVSADWITYTTLEEIESEKARRRSRQALDWERKAARGKRPLPRF